MSETVEALKALLRRAPNGLLSTLSVRHGGTPFGSVVPFALWRTGEPLLLLSGLAAHTKNLEADPRCSLLVTEPDSVDLQPARATLVGSCARLGEVDEEAARAAFTARHPDSEALQLPGFSPYVLAVQEVRWVGGFGAAAWLDGGRLRE